MKIRVFASDLDGTLLNEQSRISAKTANSIQRVQHSGNHFIAVTGRSWSTAAPIFQEAGIETDCVLLNGAEYRTSSGDVVFQETIDNNLAQKIMTALLDIGIDFEVNTDQGDFSTDLDFCTKALEFRSIDEIINSKILKFFIFSDDTMLIKKVKNYFKAWRGIAVTSSSSQNVEITSDKAQKARMLKRVIELFHVSEDEVMVFGDGENDVTMFQAFHHTRAVANANPIIRELAEYVIGSNQDHSVAEEMNQVMEEINGL